MAKIKKYFPAVRINISVPHLNEFGNKVVTNITADGIEVSKVDSNESFKKEITVLQMSGMVKMKEVEVADKAPKATPKFGSISKKEPTPVDNKAETKNTNSTKTETKNTNSTKTETKNTNSTTNSIKGKMPAKNDKKS